MTAARTRCLTVGSSDSGGGAGIQGDLKAFASLGAYGTTVLVGVTAQNTEGVTAAAPVAPEIVAAQLDAVLADIGVDAVKVGTSWSAAVVHLVADRLQDIGVPVVIDPVLTTAAGSQLSGGREAVAAARDRLLPLASVVTPNLGEARQLAELPGQSDPAVLAEALAGRGARAVLITDVGGPARGGGDWLFDGRRHHPIPGQRHTTGCEHGAGCAHSALLAVLLARQVPLARAARLAHHMVAAAVLHGSAGIGGGTHPVDMLAAARRAEELFGTGAR